MDDLEEPPTFRVPEIPVGDHHACQRQDDDAISE
jgi:hypothetical protein